MCAARDVILLKHPPLCPRSVRLNVTVAVREYTAAGLHNSRDRSMEYRDTNTHYVIIRAELEGVPQGLVSEANELASKHNLTAINFLFCNNKSVVCRVSVR